MDRQAIGAGTVLRQATEAGARDRPGAHSGTMGGLTLPGADTMRPHDLLWLRHYPADVPAWACAQRPVVVRRDRVTAQGHLPVGLRGRVRHERYGTWIDPATVQGIDTPEGLVARLRRRAGATPARWPCQEALDRVLPLLDATGLVWGVTGHVGFVLATGVDTLHADSDLDLLVRADRPLTSGQTAVLQRLGDRLPVRLDLQIDTGRGGFAWAEWAAGRRPVLLRTDTGPRLVADPWLSAS